MASKTRLFLPSMLATPIDRILRKSSVASSAHTSPGRAFWTPLVMISLMITISLGALFGQSYYGSLRGLVHDPNGAIIPNVKVTLTDKATNISRETITNSDGEYVFSLVVPSSVYAVTAEVSGFKKFEQTGIVITPAGQVTVDLNLAIGNLSETVEVTASDVQPLLVTSTGNNGQVMTRQQLSELPDFGRNLFTFSNKIAQNVIPVGNPSSSGMQTQSAVALTTVAGGMLWQNSFLIDGVNTTAWFGLPVIIPSLEAVDEMKVQLNTYDGEMGRTGGGVFNTTLKSGTNDLHGSLYGGIRRTAWDANLFFNNAAGRPLSPIPNNTLAGSVGGPVYIPKLFDGRNRVFFFAAAEGYDDSVAASATYYVPTAQERVGDFSQTKVKVGNALVPVTIYDPLSTVRNADGTYTRTPFPNAIIPRDRINAVGQNIANYYPLPGSAPAYYGAPDVTFGVSQVSKARQYIGKLDVQLFKWWMVTLSLMRQQTVAPGPNFFGTMASNQQWRLDRTANATAVNNQFVINPTTVVAVRYGFNRFPNVFYTTSEVAGFDPTSLGFPSSYVKQMMGTKFPLITLSTIMAGDQLSNGNGSWNNYVNNTVSAIVSRSQGRHSLKAGFDWRKMLVQGYGYGDMAGSFSFNGIFTQSSPVSPQAATGADLADLLLGYPSSGTTSIAQKLTDYSHYYAAYIQDDFRVNAKLTLNFGLRWERETGLQEIENRLYVNFDKTAKNPLAAGVSGINPQGVLVFAGQGGANLYVGDPNLNKVSPRVGFAYQINPKTVVRGGYGIIRAPQQTPGSPLAPASFTAVSPYIASVDGFATPANSLTNPYPTGLQQPLGTSQGSMTGIGQNVTVWNPTSQSPKIQQYSLEVQRELPYSIVVSAGYLGTRGTHLTGSTAGLDLNQNVLDPSYFSLGSALNTPVANPFYGHGGTGVIGTPTVPQYQLLLPFPTYGAVTFQSTDLNHSNYNSMVIRAQKRFSQGLMVNTMMTWARSFDLASAGNVQMPGPSGVQNPYNPYAEYAASNWQAPLVWSLMFSYELPVGKNKKFQIDNKVADYLIGGWQFNGVAAFRGGFPLSITQTPNRNSSYGYPSQRPNATGVSPVTDGTLEERLRNYINPAAFVAAPQFTYGNLTRYIPMYGPGMANWDLSLFKTVPIYERLRLQFRCELLNAFNTPLFNGPNTTFGSGSFGQITSQANTSRQLQLAMRLTW
ncbi:MAG: TonB-dependent receptor [Terriglobia bacterium]